MVADDVSTGETVNRELTVIQRTAKDESCHSPTAFCNRKNATVKLLEAVDNEDQSAAFRRVIYRYEVSVKSSDASLSPETSEFPIIFSKNSEQSAVVRFRLLQRHHPFLVGPTAIIVDGNGPNPNMLRIWARDGRTFEIDNIESSSNCVIATQVTGGAARVHEFKFTSKEPRIPNSKREEQIRIVVRSCDRPYCLSVFVRDAEQGISEKQSLVTPSINNQ